MHFTRFGSLSPDWINTSFQGGCLPLHGGNALPRARSACWWLRTGRHCSSSIFTQRNQPFL